MPTSTSFLVVATAEEGVEVAAADVELTTGEGEAALSRKAVASRVSNSAVPLPQSHKFLSQ
jgi:hypothetical protein